MKLRTSIVTIVKLATTTLAMAGGVACGHANAGKLAVDIPAVPYQAPDIDEITGIDSDADGSASGSGSATDSQPK